MILWKVIKGVFLTVILPTIIALVSALLLSGIKFELVIVFFYLYQSLILIIAVGLVAVAILIGSRVAEKEKERILKGIIGICKPVQELKPLEDFRLAKYRADIYVRRESDDEIVKRLKAGQFVLIKGKPKIGKTRAAFEAIKQFKSWYLIKPAHRELRFDKIQKIKLPSKCRKVILFLDDLNEYLGKCDVDDLIHKLKEEAKESLVLATCRIQEEFDLLKERKEVDYFLRESRPYVEPPEIDEHQQDELAQKLGLACDKVLSDGTPGSIVLEEPAMRGKYEKLKQEKPILHSLRLLREATIEEWEEGLVREVTEKIFEMDASRAAWEGAITLLELEGFIRRRVIDKLHHIEIVHDSFLDQQFVQDYRMNQIEADLLNLKEVLVEKKDSENLFYLGNGFYYTQDRNAAAQCYEDCLKINPNYERAYYNWGVALGELERHEEAIDKFKRATEINPDFADAYYNWAVFLGNLGKHEEAIEKYKRATEINPDYADAYSNWGVALGKLANYDEAIEKFEMATEINPDEAQAYYNWGFALSKLEKYEEAIKKYERAVFLNPKYKDAYLQWGVALDELEKYEEAIGKYKRATEINPDYADAYSNWGVALGKLGKHEEATEEYRMAVEINPDLAAAYYNWGNSLDALRKYEGAIEKYKMAAEINPDYAEAHSSWGVSLGKLERYEEAIEKFKTSTEINPDYAEAYGNLGIALMKLNRRNEAKKAFFTAIELLSKQGKDEDLKKIEGILKELEEE